MSIPTDTATPTLTPTFTPSVTPTVPETADGPTATLTATATPFFPSLEALLDTLANNVGTASRFNCQVFVGAYDYLVMQVERDNPAFAPARALIADQEAPVQLIYDDYCRDNPDDTQVFITFSVFGDMRRAVEDMRRVS